MIKQLFTEMFKVQEETIRKIVSSCNSDTIVRLDRLSEEIQNNYERLEKFNKETVDLFFFSTNIIVQHNKLKSHSHQAPNF